MTSVRIATNDGCVTCRANRGEVATPGGVLHDDGLWRLEHTFGPLPLAGWLVLKPLRHVESVAELTEAEASALGPLVRRASAALTAVLGCPKVYVMCFAEAADAPHVHFHLVPRAADMPRERRGPRVFEYLREARERGVDLVDPAEAERVASAVRELLADRHLTASPPAKPPPQPSPPSPRSARSPSRRSAPAPSPGPRPPGG